MHKYAPINSDFRGWKPWLLLALSSIWLSTGWAQPPQRQTTEEYIEKYRDLAVAEMHRTGIPASITLAQGILESGSGNSRLAKEGNNHFGIKCHKGWTGHTIHEDDDALNECFRKYPSAYDSYIDHSEFLMTRSRYAFIFEYERTDYKNWAKGLKKAGYATNPKYAPILIGLIERYNLQQFDLAPPVDPEPILAENGEEEDPKKKENRVKKYRTGIFMTNRIETVFMQPGQTLASIAEQQEKRLSRLERYNDVDEGYELKPGMKVFLQPKRNNGPNDYHRVKDGETLFSISQMYGVKMKHMLKNNLLEKGQEPAVGERVNLRKKRDRPPKLRRDDYTPASPVLVQKEESTKNPAEAKQVVPPKEDRQKPTTKVVKKEQAVADEAVIEESKPAEKIPAEEPAKIDQQEEDKKPAYTYVPGDSDSEATETSDNDRMEDDLEDYDTLLPQSANAQEGKNEVTNQTLDDTTSYVYHQVEQGDTLYSLSRRFGTSVQQLQQWNELAESHIQIGQTLIVGVGNSM